MIGAAQSQQPKLVPELFHVFGVFVASFWWLILIAGLIGLGRVIVWVRSERRLTRSGIAEIDTMDGVTFERRLVHLFAGLGYQVEHTCARGDYGADLVLEEGRVRTVVQAKRWSKNVGVKAIQEAVAAKPMYRCTQAIGDQSVLHPAGKTPGIGERGLALESR